MSLNGGYHSVTITFILPMHAGQSIAGGSEHWNLHLATMILLLL